VGTLGLSKEEIRRLVLAKLRIVYRDWGIDETPFARAGAAPGPRRDDPRAFVVALVAALLGGLSEAIDRNTRALATLLAGARRASRTSTESRRGPARRTTRRRRR
jgi:hypothetical protein